MRDGAYALEPAGNVVRGVILGFSTVMGWGVEQDETFEAVLEERVNRRLTEVSDQRFELLNLAVPGYRPPQQVMALEEALRFSPDIVFYTAAGREQWNTIKFLAETVAKGVEIPYPDLTALLAEAGVDSDMSETEVLQRLKPHDDTLVAWVYDRITQLSAAQGIRAVWIYVPPLFPTAEEPAEHDRARALAQAAGFEILDLTGVFDGRDPASLSLEEWDRHPTAEAHAMIAELIYEAMAKDPSDFGLSGL
jgi:hypothetical protein